MAIYMPPLCRKKKVIERYNPDSFRVISQDAENQHHKYDFVPSNEPSEWRRQWLQNSGLALPDIYNKRTEVLSHSAPDYRAHKPHPGSCGFLRYNVRFLNEPVCSVYTEETRSEQQNWWPSRISTEPLREPPKTKDTIYRADFTAERDKSQIEPGSTRHTANPNKESALGIVPVNFLRARDGKQRFFNEKISYEHQYNSRKDPNYPIRSKRHGSFVWDQMSREKTKKFVDNYQVITPEEGVRRQERQEAEKLASQAKQLAIQTSVPETTVAAPETAPKQPSPKQVPSDQPVDTATTKPATPNLEKMAQEPSPQGSPNGCKTNQDSDAKATEKVQTQDIKENSEKNSVPENETK